MCSDINFLFFDFGTAVFDMGGLSIGVCCLAIGSLRRMLRHSRLIGAAMLTLFALFVLFALLDGLCCRSRSSCIGAICSISVSRKKQKKK